MIWFQFAEALLWWGVFIWGGISIARQTEAAVWDRAWSIAAWLFWPVVVPVLFICCPKFAILIDLRVGAFQSCIFGVVPNNLHCRPKGAGHGGPIDGPHRQEDHGDN